MSDGDVDGGDTDGDDTPAPVGIWRWVEPKSGC